jgi:hypothetical protein
VERPITILETPLALAYSAIWAAMSSPYMVVMRAPIVRQLQIAAQLFRALSSAFPPSGLPHKARLKNRKKLPPYAPRRIPFALVGERRGRP